MTTPRPEDYARQFPENGMKLLRQEPLNLRDLLTVARCDFTDDIDYARVQPDPTTYVQHDYRHLESDLVLRCAVRGRRLRTILWLYILLEHQTEPDRFMALRLLEYVTAIYRAQAREWLQTHETLTGLELMPVLPIVFYTGLRPWAGVGGIADLLAGGGRFAALAPQFEPLFVNLRETPAGRLARSGPFGQVLRLVQGRRRPSAEFRTILESVVQALETMPASQRPRWQGLLSYLHALVYHERDPGEHAEMQDRIEHAVRTERRREEVQAMRKTIADMFREEGHKRGLEEGSVRSKRQTLLRQLRLRFGDLPADTVAIVEGCTNLEQLDAWLDAFANARTLAQVGIHASN